jgi:signal transduction histidine kinase
MAHDLKNPLAAAMGWSEYLIEEFRQKHDDENRQNAERLKSALDQVAATIDRYQRISKLEPVLAPLDPNSLVASVVSMQKSADGSVVVKQELAPDVPAFRGDRDLLASALANLVQNALQAMPSHGGTITVSTRVQQEGDVPRLVLAVADTGLGFDARAREQAFELFFTTKARGSGLGLAFVRQVARAHGGDATLTSREGVGSTVSMHLPLNVERAP